MSRMKEIGRQTINYSIIREDHCAEKRACVSESQCLCARSGQKLTNTNAPPYTARGGKSTKGYAHTYGTYVHLYGTSSRRKVSKKKFSYTFYLCSKGWILAARPILRIRFGCQRRHYSAEIIALPRSSELVGPALWPAACYGRLLAIGKDAPEYIRKDMAGLSQQGKGGRLHSRSLCYAIFSVFFLLLSFKRDKSQHAVIAYTPWRRRASYIASPPYHSMCYTSPAKILEPSSLDGWI